MRELFEMQALWTRKAIAKIASIAKNARIGLLAMAMFGSSGDPGNRRRVTGLKDLSASAHEHELTIVSESPLPWRSSYAAALSGSCGGWRSARPQWRRQSLPA